MYVYTPQIWDYMQLGHYFFNFPVKEKRHPQLLKYLVTIVNFRPGGL